MGAEAENAGRAFALVVVDELARDGVRHAVIAPGSRSTPLALALLEHPDIAVHVRIDERSAAYLALGIAKAGRQVVPVLCTSGTAATYFHGAVLEADLARVPLLVLTADRPPELHGIGANQTVEQEGLYGGAVRWAPTVQTPESRPGVVDEWRELIAVACAHCRGETGNPSGPVHLNLPLREPLIAVSDGIGFPHDLGLGASRPPSPTGEVARHAPAELQARIAAAERGVVVAGDPGDLRPDDTRRFAERLRWPLIAEPHSGARSGALALRATDLLLADPKFVAAHVPDLAVVVGRVGLSRTLIGWLGTVPHVVVTDGGHWDVAGTAEAVYPGSLNGIDHAPAPPDWAARWRTAAEGAGERLDAILDAETVLTEPRVVRDVVDRLPPGSTLVVSSSMPIRDLDLVMNPRDGIEIVANRGVSGIDGFVSTAVGAAIARAQRGPTVAVCGDLSLLHDINGLTPGSDDRPDLTIVVINNDGGGIFSLLPQGSAVQPAAFERLFGTPHGMSFAKLASAYEVEHLLVTDPDELARTLPPTHGTGGLRIVEVRTDRTANAALHARLR